MIAADHKGMFLVDWFTEQMRGDMYEDGFSDNPHGSHSLEEIDREWPRAYVLTPPTWSRSLDTAARRG